MELKEVITLEKNSDGTDNEEAWVCICGNRPTDAGFFPCDADGNEMVPVKESDWNGLYVCNSCGRIIDQDTLEVVGQNPNPKMLD
jgi:hypothetical protein